MKPVLDSTAGNRIMWRGKNPPLNQVVFMDRETKLKIPPDLFADNRYCPFRDKVFSIVIYDPPFMARRNPPQYWNDPQMTEYTNLRGFKTARNLWWGLPKTKRELLSGIHRAQLEFQRITERLCLKWVIVDYSLWKILPFFKDWFEILRVGFKQGRNKEKGYVGMLRASKDKNCKTWWITFIHLNGGQKDAR